MFIDTEDVLHALDHNEVVPCFQPLISLSTGKLAGFEILARWDSTSHGLILPENFISLAEENGVIGRLTQQLLEKAFRQGSKLPEPLSLSVNISPLQMRNASLVGLIFDAANAAAFPLDLLTIEITESSLLSDLPKVQETARALKDMGCRLSLDDFGTGFSSLGSLRTLQFDEVKIDRCFISNMTTERESRKIIAAIVGLGHSLGLTSVAEGVETEEQAEMLQRMGCERGQGWLFGRPATADKVPMMVASPRRVALNGAARKQLGHAPSSLEALAQLQAVYDGAPVGLCFLDLGLNHVTVNHQLADMTGLSVAAVTGKKMKEVVPELYPEIEPYLLRALHGEKVMGVEVSWNGARHKAGNQNSLLSFMPACDEANEVIGVSVAMMDISGQKRAEQDLQDSKEESQHMRKLHPQASWTMDANGDNLVVESPSMKMCGFSEDWTQNLGWLAEINPKDVDAIKIGIRDAIRRAKPFDLQYRVRDINGEWGWMRSSGTPHLDENRKVRNWYGCIEDIDDYKQMEEALRESEGQMQSLFQVVRKRLPPRKAQRKAAVAAAA